MDSTIAPALRRGSFFVFTWIPVSADLLKWSTLNNRWTPTPSSFQSSRLSRTPQTTCLTNDRFTGQQPCALSWHLSCDSASTCALSFVACLPIPLAVTICLSSRDDDLEMPCSLVFYIKALAILSETSAALNGFLFLSRIPRRIFEIWWSTSLPALTAKTYLTITPSPVA